MVVAVDANAPAAHDRGKPAVGRKLDPVPRGAASGGGTMFLRLWQFTVYVLDELSAQRDTEHLRAAAYS